ncbi:MAG: response regulator transcription factor [Nitrospiraceae bacterium]|nr:response regulator transcription factor [Nitrospiraceae bacterium]
MARRSPIRVLLVDDHSLVRIGIREQLAGCQDFSVVGEAASVKQAVELAHSLTPQVVMLDLNLPDGSGIQACRRILADAPDMRVLIMTICDDSAAVRAAIAAGAHGYALKDIRPDMLVEAVRTVATGISFFHPRSMCAVLSASSAVSDPEALYGLGELSRQEQRILPLLGEGKTNKEIGFVLALSEKTVKNYLSNMFRKLKISRRTQAVTLYQRQQQRCDLLNV